VSTEETVRWRVATVLFIALFAALGATIASQAIVLTSDPGPVGVCVKSFDVPGDPYAEQIITDVTAPTRDASGVLVCSSGTFVEIGRDAK
jgi:hypothetical protein